MLSHALPLLLAEPAGSRHLEQWKNHKQRTELSSQPGTTDLWDVGEGEKLVS